VSSAVKILFAAGNRATIPGVIAKLCELEHDLPLIVVSEFADSAQHGEWIAFNPSWSLRENIAYCKSKLAGRRLRLAATILEPRVPLGKLRAMAAIMAPYRLLLFNENSDHFPLDPRSIGTLARHAMWRTKNWARFHTNPGGRVYTWWWRFRNPGAMERPFAYRVAKLAGDLCTQRKALTGHRAAPKLSATRPPEGISVVIPSRNGRELLDTCLPALDGASEVIVVDNGSDDGTADWLRLEFPNVTVESSAEPLSFARAVNIGIARATYSHICLLNNDMIVERGFIDALRRAFDEVPHLFCATAQIFFPSGKRREETGKAIMPLPERASMDFPLRCDLPAEGEDLSYVLYGSGGCSLYDARRLKALNGFDTIFEPAYCEDLDLGVRGWQHGWPTVFVNGARVVHAHRATTSRYYSEDELERVLERNYLRFLARTIQEPRVFDHLWRHAIDRLNLRVTITGSAAALVALHEARRAPSWIRPGGGVAESVFLPLTTGAVAVFPGRAARNKPVVVVASPYLPFPLSHGGAVRIFNLMRRAAADFTLVLIACVDQPAVPAELLEICAEVVTVRRTGSHARPSSSRPDTVEEFDLPEFHAALKQTCDKWQPGIVQLEFTQMAVYADDCPPAKTILVEHDITFDLYAQMLRRKADWQTRREHRRWVKFEKASWKHVDAVVTMSKQDKKIVGKVRKAATLENGVDIERFQPSSEPPEAARLLFIGSFAHLPNVLAMEWFLREVWPKLAHLNPVLHVIAGSRYQYHLDRFRDRAIVNLDQPGIEVEDFVSDVRPAYRRATVVIAPLLASAGTNIKIMEAMAMGKAIVSTMGGVHGLDVKDGTDVVIADLGTETAAAIADLFTNTAKRRFLEQQARRTAVQRYDWDAIAVRQRELYEKLMRPKQKG